jgi:hypothetical protein
MAKAKTNWAGVLKVSKHIGTAILSLGIGVLCLGIGAWGVGKGISSFMSPTPAYAVKAPSDAKPDTSTASASDGASKGAVKIPDAAGMSDLDNVAGTREDHNRSYREIKKEGRTEGMEFKGVTFLDYDGLMDLAHKACAAPARKSAAKPRTASSKPVAPPPNDPVPAPPKP